MKPIKIAVADDQNLFRESLCTLLRAIPDFHLVHDAMNGLLFLEQVRQPGQVPDVALVDLQMPVMDGLELTRTLHAEYPSIKIIILSIYNEASLVSRLIDDGIHGYLEKNCDSSELERAIRNVALNGFYINEKLHHAIRSAQRPGLRVSRANALPGTNLSQKEKTVLQLICAELSSEEIADKLHLSPRTVEWHRKNLLLKTGSRNTAGLVLFSIRHGIYYA